MEWRTYFKNYFTRATGADGETIRAAFRKKLLLLVVCAFAVSFTIAYYMQTRQADERARSFLAGQMEFLCDRVKVSRNNNEQLKITLNDDLVSKAKSFALMLKLQPDIAANQEILQESCADYNLTGVRITDATGEIVAGYPEHYVGQFNYGKHRETLKYMPLIKNQNLIIVDGPRLSSDLRADYYMYAGVARLDQPGIIQVAMEARDYNKSMDVTSYQNLAADYTVGDTGAVYILDKTGTVVGATDSRQLGLNLEQLHLNGEKYEQLNGFFKATPKGGTPSLCAYDKHENYMIVAAYPESEIYTKRNSLLAWNGVLYFLLFLAVYALVSLLLETAVVKNIFNVNKSLSEITEGNLDEKVNVREYQEFGMLSNGINSTVDALKKAIAEAAARLDRELEMGRIIQSSSLPNKFPPWPDIKAFDIFADMQMATQVGGDFYDFFLIGDKLGFAIGDVSGHGVPAALYEMTARTHIKNLMLEDGDLGAEFAQINNLLCDNNEAMMFVTVFAGVLDYKTGLLTCINAGHNKPLLKQDGKYDWLRERSGLLMGSMDHVKYKPFTRQLKHGDVLYIYTDGITEANNKAEEMFGNDRLQNLLNSDTTDDVTVITESVKKAVQDFSEGLEPADDQTMLVIKWN
ncbi:MAG: SpoIIE family protein phosphatase [Acidaminococcaceae bacterium]|jgi:serine phosphatase RsbU (regulator of sigma subunit)|nr:SpoIIE family protein phosphatase [Acidaminococcaceae bacterium]